MKIASALVVVVGVLVGHAVPPVDVPAGPGGRNKPGFVYDSARKSFVLFGGFGSGSPGLHDDTWEWNGAPSDQGRRARTVRPRSHGDGLRQHP